MTPTDPLLKTTFLPPEGVPDTPEVQEWYANATESHAKFVAKDAIDPKGEAGNKKTPLQLIPPIFKAGVAWVLRHGNLKYGPWNWRKTKVECQTYVGAINRHLDAWQSGEDLDPESGQSHLAHVAASVAILMDAEEQGTLVDNRPHKI